MKADELKTEILEELGSDVYVVYPDDERHLIAEAILLSIASACIAEFLKGLVDFKALGEATRHKLGELCSSFRHKDQRKLERYQDSGEIEELLVLIKSSPGRLSGKSLADAEQNLADALRQLGMDEERAAQHSRAVATIISSTLNTEDSV